MLPNACVRYVPEDGSSHYSGTRDEEIGEEDRGEPIAWVFLSGDSSMTSLHVEPVHRGKGLARAVVRALMAIAENGEQRWISSDVYWDNPAGEAVVKGLGAVEGWRGWWVGVDVMRAREIWERVKEEGSGGGSARLRCVCVDEREGDGND